MRHPIVAKATFFFIVLASCVCALGLDPSLDISQYAHTEWKVRDGFTKGVINAITQTPDGYLWLGTESGLYRFDGVRAVPWRPPAGEHLVSNFIQSLLVSRDGTLWIGAFGGFASWKDGKLTKYPELDGFSIPALLEDHQGTVWIGDISPSGGNLCTVKAGKITCSGARAFGQGVTALYEDRKGNLWVSAATGLWRWAPRRSERFEFAQGVTLASSLTEDDTGVLVLVTNSGPKQLASGKIQDYRMPVVSAPRSPGHLLRSSDGSLWIATQKVLLHLHRGRAERFSSDDDFSGAIFEDREGSFWVGGTDGLHRFREFAIPTISRQEGLLGAWAVQATPDGSVWIASRNGVNLWANGELTVYRSQTGPVESSRANEPRPGTISRVVEISNSGLEGAITSLGLDIQQIWASTTKGVFYFDDGRFVRVPEIPGDVSVMAGDGHRNVWIADANAGLFYRTPTGTVQKIPWSRFKQRWPRTLAPDPLDGGLWVGFLQGGMAYLRDGEVRTSYSAADGLGSGRVTHIRFGSNASLWVATEGGLSLIRDGHIATLTSKNGLPCDEVHWSMEDDDHAAWLYMPCGLARIEHSELDKWVNDSKHIVKKTFFDASDGVRSVGVYGTIGPLVTKSRDGRMWFAPYDGVSIIDPHHLGFNTLPPPVRIEQITGDGKTYDTSNGLRLPPHLRNIAIEYTALSLVAPEKTHFRYKLEGQDPDWREVVNDRQVQYSNLAPRQYTFRVIACNNSGVWNEAGASLEFSVLPAFYQTNWFRSLCAVGFLALLWGVYQLRIRELRRQFNIALDARVGERTRIARDLHDTLLQNFHGLMFQFQAARNLITRRPDEAMRSLDDAIDETKKALAESREAIQDLRSEPIAKGNLAELLMRTSQELAGSNSNEHPPVFDLIEEGERRALASTVSSEVCRIALELLRNVYQHAQAQRIEAEIRYGDSTFRLRIRDDGRGIDPKVLREGGRDGHWGLRGVRERADRTGAQLDLWSEPGSGTEAQLLVPAEIAYENHRDGHRAKLFPKLKRRV